MMVFAISQRSLETIQAGLQEQSQETETDGVTLAQWWHAKNGKISPSLLHKKHKGIATF
jgi:hypothetical protein